MLQFIIIAIKFPWIRSFCQLTKAIKTFNIFFFFLSFNWFIIDFLLYWSIIFVEVVNNFKYHNFQICNSAISNGISLLVFFLSYVNRSHGNSSFVYFCFYVLFMFLTAIGANLTSSSDIVFLPSILTCWSLILGFNRCFCFLIKSLTLFIWDVLHLWYTEFPSM